jgi:hypothetical protein
MPPGGHRRLRAQSLELDPALVGSVMVEAGHLSSRNGGDVRAMDGSPLGAELLDATVRLVRLLDTPAEARVLRSLITREGEVIAGVSLTTAIPYLALARRQIEGWLQAGTLPYALEPLPPLSTAWWGLVRRLMQWRVRLERTRPIAVRSTDTEIETLYEALVRPHPQQRCRSG